MKLIYKQRSFVNCKKKIKMAYHQFSVPEEALRKGPWLEEEDERLIRFVTLLGERRWDSLAGVSGLKRSGKSCRLRWLNYLRPNLKHGSITEEEEKIILQLHALWGNKWSRIARRLPGRTDNEIKNYWRTHLRKKTQHQEQEKFSNKWVSAEQDFSHQINEADTRIQKPDAEGLEEVNEKSSETEKHATNGTCGLKDFAIMSSPYETRISDWIYELSTDQSEAIRHEDHSSSSSSSSSTDSFFFSPWWVSENRDVDEFSCSLWT